MHRPRLRLKIKPVSHSYAKLDRLSSSNSPELLGHWIEIYMKTSAAKLEQEDFNALNRQPWPRDWGKRMNDCFLSYPA